MSDARGPITIRDVAALAGVSVTTVSNFFNHPGRMTAATRARVASAVETLGFSPNDAARSLRRGRSTVVGYLSFELASARTPAITTAMGDRLAEAGMHLLSAVDGGDPARERAYLDLFERQRIAGLVVTPVTDLEPYLARLRRAGLPSVLSAQRAGDPDQPSVSVDHRHGGRLAAEHLLATGRRRLGFVADTLDLHQVAERFQERWRWWPRTPTPRWRWSPARRARWPEARPRPRCCGARPPTSRRRLLRQRPGRARRLLGPPGIDVDPRGDGRGGLRRHRVRPPRCRPADHHPHAAGGPRRCRRGAAPGRDGERPRGGRTAGRPAARASPGARQYAPPPLAPTSA